MCLPRQHLMDPNRPLLGQNSYKRRGLLCASLLFAILAGLVTPRIARLIAYERLLSDSSLRNPTNSPRVMAGVASGVGPDRVTVFGDSFQIADAGTRPPELRADGGDLVVRSSGMQILFQKPWSQQELEAQLAFDASLRVPRVYNSRLKRVAQRAAYRWPTSVIEAQDARRWGSARVLLASETEFGEHLLHLLLRLVFLSSARGSEVWSIDGTNVLVERGVKDGTPYIKGTIPLRSSGEYCHFVVVGHDAEALERTVTTMLASWR